jgi:hypothetical protein
MKLVQTITPVIIFVVTSNAVLSMDTQVRQQNKTLPWIGELSKEEPNLEVIKQIALQGAVNVNIAAVVPRKEGTITKYAILEAAKKRDWNLVEILLEAGANPTVTTELKHSAVRYAIYVGNIDILTKLIQKGVQTNIPDYNGTTDEQAASLFGLNLFALRQKN